MAIQNDLFKREMVQHERIEREIQLARQIQETFLPDQLPIFARLGNRHPLGDGPPGGR